MIAVKDYKGGTITQGLWRMDAATYHSDPLPQPSLSNSIIQTILESSPLHAWTIHPRLGNAGEEDMSRRMEVGSAAHKLALDAGQEVVVIQADSYRSKAAMEARDAAVDAGRIPCLADDYETAKAIAGPLREAAEAYLGLPMKECLRETVVVWQAASGGWRRAMIDAMTPDLLRVVDLKSTAGSASPGACVGRICDNGLLTQCAHYLNGLDTIDPDNRGRRKWAFLFGETDQPFAVSPPIELSEGAMTIARQQVAQAELIWDACLKSDIWPGFSQQTHVAEIPPWFVAKWEGRMLGDETLNPPEVNPKYANV